MWRILWLAGFLLEIECLKWEFGQDGQSLVVANHFSGEIEQQEYVTEITIELTCVDLKYVSVTIYNNFSNPSVTFNKYTNTVKIAYKPTQMTRSDFEITAKGRRTLNCSSAQLQKLKGDGGGCSFVNENGAITQGCGYGWGLGGG